LYAEGVNSRLDSLADQYLLKTVELDINDLIIDIGANIGEFSKYLLEKGFGDIVCIEPEQMEAHACDANVFNGQKETIRKCLWNYSGILRFYLHNNTGDSSATPNDLKWPSVEVRCITLDEIIKERGIERIGLIKLEAEGSEPEVLGGALKSIALTKWILAALGHEREPEQESTFLEVNRILLDNHFVLVAKGRSGLRESHKYRNLRVN
jgi:FkbM family methyltransferase